MLIASNKLLKRTLIIALAGLFLLMPLARPVVAGATPCPEGMSELDCAAIYGDWSTWIPDNGNTCGGQPSTVTTGTGTLSKGSSVYILGDSITVRTQSAYKKAFGDKGITPQINAVVGRSWNSPGNGTQSGQQAVVADASLIKAAGGIVVSLGSNNGIGGNPIVDVVSAIRKDNPSAPIWWVNTTGTTYSGKSLKYLGTFNKALGSAATTNNFQIVNWATAVAPGSNPFTTPGTSAADPNHLLEDGLHPNPSGVSLLANLVVAAVSGGVAGGSAASAGVSASASCCESSSTNLQGSDNQQKALNFFVSKGLTAVQAAAIVGNLMGESGTGINPKAQEDKSSDPFPKNGVGFGIAQWTFSGRQDLLTKYAKNRNTPVTDFGIQLSFVWAELSGGYKQYLAELKNTNDISQATYIILYNYEAPGDKAMGGPNHIKRTDYAKGVLQLYGAGASSATGTTVTSTCSSGNSGIGTGKGKFTDNTTIKYSGVDKMLQRAVAFADLKGTMFAKECINANNPNGVNCTGWCAHVAATTWGYQTGTYGSFSTSALGQWEYMKSTGHAHPGDRNPPVGALLFYDTGGQPGHVVVYLGNNKVISNDVYNAKSGVDGGVYIADAADMENGTWHLPFLGWADPYYSGNIGNSKL